MTVPVTITDAHLICNGVRRAEPWFPDNSHWTG